MRIIRAFLAESIRILSIIGLVVSLSVASWVHAETVHFDEGERFIYDITWFGLNVGTGTMEVQAKEDYEGKEIYHIVSTARSNAMISLIFPVEDKIETFVDVNGIYSYHIKIKQRHGSRRVNKEIIFDQEQHKATMIYKGKSRTYTIPPKVQDSLSSLYFFRTLNDLKVGESVYIDVHESKKNWRLEIQILDQEQVTTSMGAFDTIKTKALVRYDGVLLSKGDVYIWFSDDERKIPVKISGKVSIGHFIASLASASLPALVASPR